MRIPTLRQLQYFLSVADTLSISRSAEACHVTQSTLSAGLAELEDILGTPLFDRGTRHMRLTPTGTTLLPEATAILRQSEKLVHLANLHKDPLSAPLTLGVIPTIAPYILPKLLPLVQTEFPRLDLPAKVDGSYSFAGDVRLPEKISTRAADQIDRASRREMLQIGRAHV